jgi:hypothetical protein
VTPEEAPSEVKTALRYKARGVEFSIPGKNLRSSAFCQEASQSRLKAGPAAALALRFLVTELNQTLAFAILAFLFFLAGVLLHGCSNPIPLLLTNGLARRKE